MDTHLIIMEDDHSFPNADKPGSSSFNEPGFEVSDFFELSDWVEEDPSLSSLSSPLSAASYDTQSFGYTPDAGSSGITSCRSSLEGAINMLSGESEREMKERVAFKTKSEVEVLDDGFKWRKYGKKMVKNSPNPRNYYRCSVEGCPVKKRVERDKEDPLYVVTTYEGIHNHQVLPLL